MRALAETEKPLNGDVWFWTDDNAKALEAYLVPEAYARYQDIADSLLSFVRRMSEGPVILRRIAKPALNVESENPDNFRVGTGLMTFHGNLRRDELAISYRFHDGRDVDAVKLSGNRIRFDLGGRTYQFDVKDSITSARLARRDGLVILEHVSEYVVSGFGPVARATYSYTIDPALTRLLLDISVEALGGATLRNVQVTSAMDQLSELPQGSLLSPVLRDARGGPIVPKRCGGSSHLAGQGRARLVQPDPTRQSWLQLCRPYPGHGT